MKTRTLSPDLPNKFDAYGRTANDLATGQVYLYNDPLLKRPLTIADIKKMLRGHRGAPPWQNFICEHLNLIIKKFYLNMVFVSGPGRFAAGNGILQSKWIFGITNKSDQE